MHHSFVSRPAVRETCLKRTAELKGADSVNLLPLSSVPARPPAVDSAATRGATRFGQSVAAKPATRYETSDGAVQRRAIRLVWIRTRPQTD